MPIRTGKCTQRTVYFETELQPDQEFMVEYAYDYHVDYVELDPARAAAKQPDFCLEEQAPHIMFTPYLRELRDELAGDETNPVILARRFYDFVTTKVMYSYMREYFTIDCIPEYCAVNQKGDCGVQALLFITLCRMSGIPARWQSGLYATEFYTGCHDWAQFYVELMDGYLPIRPLAAAPGVPAIPNVGIIISAIWIFPHAGQLRNSDGFMPEKKWLRGDQSIISAASLNMKIMVFYSQLEVNQELISMEEI
ncbi:MAG: transglutaminase-like domain-containing protein [Frisingicoccus sp.]